MPQKFTRIYLILLLNIFYYYSELSAAQACLSNKYDGKVCIWNTNIFDLDDGTNDVSCRTSCRKEQRGYLTWEEPISQNIENEDAPVEVSIPIKSDMCDYGPFMGDYAILISGCPLSKLEKDNALFRKCKKTLNNDGSFETIWQDLSIIKFTNEEEGQCIKCVYEPTSNPVINGIKIENLESNLEETLVSYKNFKDNIATTPQIEEFIGSKMDSAEDESSLINVRRFYFDLGLGNNKCVAASQNTEYGYDYYHIEYNFKVGKSAYARDLKLYLHGINNLTGNVTILLNKSLIFESYAQDSLSTGGYNYNYTEDPGEIYITSCDTSDYLVYNNSSSRDNRNCNMDKVINLTDLATDLTSYLNFNDDNIIDVYYSNKTADLCGGVRFYYEFDPTDKAINLYDETYKELTNIEDKFTYWAGNDVCKKAIEKEEVSNICSFIEKIE